MAKKLVYGVGVNDSAAESSWKENGKRVICPYYVRWTSMLSRCYSDNFHKIRPMHKGCTVCDEWLIFSNFKAWMEKQDWRGMSLDKDLLKQGNRIYCPEYCVFITAGVNSFLNDQPNQRGICPAGVCEYSNDGINIKFRSRCCNPFTKCNEHIGVFDCPNDAHLAWKRRKHELACQLADLQKDNRVAEALRNRYTT